MYLGCARNLFKIFLFERNQEVTHFRFWFMNQKQKKSSANSLAEE